jgi:hypothetical protein
MRYGTTCGHFGDDWCMYVDVVMTAKCGWVWHKTLVAKAPRTLGVKTL